MGGVYLYLDCGVQCDVCGKIEEFPFQIDLIAASRQGLGKAKQMRAIRRDIEDAAMGARWFIKGQSVYCPDCAEKLESGSIQPLMNTIDAKGAINSLRVMMHVKNTKPKDKE